MLKIKKDKDIKNVSFKKTKIKKPKEKLTFKKYKDSNKKSNIFILILLIGLLIRMGLYFIFSARFIIDITFIVAVFSLLLMLVNKFNYKEPKDTSFNKYYKWFKLVLLVMISTVFYMDTFIASRDIYTIVKNTDEQYVYSYDLEGEGRRYFTASSETISKVNKFPAYELSNGKIKDSYFIDSETGVLVDNEGKPYIRK